MSVKRALAGRDDLASLRFADLGALLSVNRVDHTQKIDKDLAADTKLYSPL